MTVINFKILVYYYFKTKQTKQKQTTNSQNLNASFRTRSERIFTTKTIFQLLKNMIRLEAPIPTIGTILVSVKRQILPEHEKEGTDLLVVKALSIGYRQNERRKCSR